MSQRSGFRRRGASSTDPTCNDLLGPIKYSSTQMDQPDYNSVSTYLPSVVLTIWLSSHAGLTCVLIGETWSSHLVVLSFAVNWWFTPRATGHWNLVRYGVGVWLSWIAYGEVLHCNADVSGGDTHPMAFMTANVMFATAATMATVVNDESIYLNVAAMLFVGGLMAPSEESSFAKCSCGIKVAKAAVFAVTYSFMYLCRERTADRVEKHFQAVTISAGWILVAHHNLMLLTVVQGIYTAHVRGYLYNVTNYKESESTYDLENVPDDLEHQLSEQVNSGPHQGRNRSTEGRPTTEDGDGAQTGSSLSEREKALLSGANASSSWRGMSIDTQSRPSATTTNVDVARLKAMAQDSNR